jgi:hypothetical protein
MWPVYSFGARDLMGGVDWKSKKTSMDTDLRTSLILFSIRGIAQSNWRVGPPQLVPYHPRIRCFGPSRRYWIPQMKVNNHMRF